MKVDREVFVSIRGYSYKWYVKRYGKNVCRIVDKKMHVGVVRSSGKVGEFRTVYMPQCVCV